MLAGRYRIFGLVGRGGMGEVYRADDVKLGQAVALKFLPADVEADPDRLERFLGEVRIARQISHPNVCRVYDAGEVDGHHFLSMEFVDGEDLASLLRRIGRLPRDKALQIAREMCAGLAAAHEQGVLHRDLKPANVMIDGRGRARITDFGLARHAGEVRGADLLAGTPAFMAPEQIAGRAVTVRSDLYSLGLVLYELCTGQPAFKAATAAEMARLKSESTPTSPGQIVDGFDPAVERVIMRCLERDPADRPASALAVAASLPGGDPLAAALAAGETPSPELVAEAGAVGGLSPAAAWSCLAALAAGLTTVVLLARHAQITQIVPLEKPPEVLVERARQVLHRLGYDDRPADTTFEFNIVDPYVDYLARHQTTRAPWARLEQGPPFAIEFSYRQSPEPLVPISDIATRPDQNDPPSTVAGMVDVRVDPQGRLRWLRAVPPLREAPAAGAAGVSAAAGASAATAAPAADEPDWSPLLAEAGLDTAALRRVEPEWRPAVAADRRAAWVGNYAAAAAAPPAGDVAGTAFRIEAAAWRGRIVAFRFVDPWDPGLAAGAPAPNRWIETGEMVFISVVITAMVAAVGIARRNLLLGRGDRRGALRLAAFIVAAGTVYWLVRAHHFVSGVEIPRFVFRTGMSLAIAGLVWLAYLALEPHLRRLWPGMIVSWVRLLNGRMDDPLVGRDVVYGLLAGVAFSAISQAMTFVPARFGLACIPPNQQKPPFAMVPLADLRSAAAMPFLLVGASLLIPMAIMVLLLLFRILLRKTWLAIIVLTAVFSVAGPVTTGSVAVDMVMGILSTGLHTYLLFRFGLLVIVVASFTGAILGTYPMTFDLGTWPGGLGLFAFVIVAALAILGVRAALAGRSAFGDAALAPARAE